MFLSNGQKVGLQEALRSERNLLQRLKRSSLSRQLQDSLWSSRTTIETICAYHLGIHASQCSVADRSAWTRGQFNLCIPVAAQVHGHVTTKLFRCPIPHKAGSYCNASEEKVRVEAANYAYVEANCPDIPLAPLVGFGFSGKHVRFI